MPIGRNLCLRDECQKPLYKVVKTKSADELYWHSGSGLISIFKKRLSIEENQDEGACMVLI